MIHHLQGNVLQSSAAIIAHGCNCRGSFGAGVALQIALQWPMVKEAYRSKFLSTEGWRLGDVQFVYTGSVIIANCATQENYGRKGTHADYDAIRTCMIKLKDFAAGRSIALPKIGAGLAGGDWNRIEAILQDVFGDSDNVTVYSL